MVTGWVGASGEGRRRDRTLDDDSVSIQVKGGALSSDYLVTLRIKPSPLPWHTKPV